MEAELRFCLLRSEYLRLSQNQPGLSLTVWLTLYAPPPRPSMLDPLFPATRSFLRRVLNTTMEVPPTVYLDGVDVLGSGGALQSGGRAQQPLIPLPLQVSNERALWGRANHFFRTRLSRRACVRVRVRVGCWGGAGGYSLFASLATAWTAPTAMSRSRNNQSHVQMGCGCRTEC